MRLPRLPFYSMRTRHRHRRLLPTLMLLVVIGAMAVPLPALASSPGPVASPDDPELWYSSGLEPGSSLAGFTLPLDWTDREPACPEGESREHIRLRLSDASHPALCLGDVSEGVIHLQQLLTEKKLYRREITGRYDEATRYAVVAFHKILGPSHDDPRTAVAEWKASPPPADWTEEDWALLEAFEPRAPKYRENQPDRVEVDIGHQVLYLILDDEVDAIIPVSTGAGSGERGCRVVGCSASVTPRTERLAQGSAFYYEHAYNRGWSPLPGPWAIYKAIFYKGQYGEWNYAIHGYRQVPDYPASHGCTRVTTWDMDYLRPGTDRDDPASRVRVGMTIHVWDA